MAYKYNRNKLKSHTAGRNRHSKGAAYEDKKARQQKVHARTQSTRKKHG